MSRSCYSSFVIASLIVLLPGLGCRKPADADRTADAPKDAFNPLDPLGGAPDSWEDFLPWADAQLTIRPDPVPLPSKPRLAEPAMGVIRLDEQLRNAVVRCAWQPPNEQAVALKSVGPFRGDRPAANWVMEERKLNPYQSTTRLTVTGFSVVSEDVGRITLDVHVPWGAHLDVIWSDAGKIRLPLPSNDRSWKLSVTTDGLADWQGPLSELVLQPDGTGNGVIVVNAIQFIGRENAFPDPVGTGRIALSKETRNAVYTHAPTSMRWDDITIPRNGTLQTGIGMIAGRKHGGTPSCQFAVSVEHEGRVTKVLTETITTPNRWHDVSVSLAQFADQSVTLLLETDGKDDTVALWANPIVYEPVTDPPIVVFYLIDTLASKHMDLYGYERDTMPHLSALAEQGVWFTQMFANSPKTVYSVPDYTFSMPTARHGVYHASIRAPDALISLAESFRAAGFATTNYCTNVNAGPRQNVDQGFDHFTDHIAYWWNTDADRTVPVEQVMRWVDVHRDRPMFIYIHTAEPHGPYTPPKGFAGRYDTGYRGPINGHYDNENHGFATARTPDEITHVVSLYDEECAYADHRLHHFLETLRAAGLADRLNLVVTSDHGEEFSEHGAWTHGKNIYNEVQRVPLVLVGPKIAARGAVDVPVQLHDIMPTLLELFGLPQPYALNGDSLAPFLIKDSPSRRDALKKRTLFASNHGYRPANVIEANVIEEGRWKLMYRFAKEMVGKADRPVRFELYDMQRDYDERDNIIDTHRDRARVMIGKLIAFRRTQSPFAATLDTDQLELTPDQLRELQSLGYIGQFESSDE